MKQRKKALSVAETAQALGVDLADVRKAGKRTTHLMVMAYFVARDINKELKRLDKDKG